MARRIEGYRTNRQLYLRDYGRKWIAERRADYFRDKCCAKCGSTDRMELDHIDPKTKVTHAIWSWSATRQAEELAKCQVLCHDCHAIKTHGFVRDMNRHGTINKYRHDECRCATCTYAWVIYSRHRRKRLDLLGSDGRIDHLLVEKLVEQYAATGIDNAWN